MTAPENHEAWARSFVTDPASMSGVIVLDEDPPSTITTCPQCRALFPVGGQCPGFGTDSQAAPGQPFPDDNDPEEPTPEK